MISLRKQSIAVLLVAFVSLTADSSGLQSASPTVSAPFRGEVAELARKGLVLREALEGNFTSTGQHLAAIFERQPRTEDATAYEFRILESSSQGVRTIFRRTEFFFSFSAGEFTGLNGADITGDGLREIVVQSSSGGNCWSCNPTEIYQVRGGKGELVAAGPIQGIVDLNSDRSFELLVADARWNLYAGLPNAASPSPTIIFAWKGGRYSYASREYQAFYDREIDRLRGEIESAKGEIGEEEFSDDRYVGLAVTLAVNHAHAGSIDRALRELEGLMKANIRSAVQAERRREIIDDFSRGESWYRLRSMQYGDPMLG